METTKCGGIRWQLSCWSTMLERIDFVRKLQAKLRRKRHCCFDEVQGTAQNRQVHMKLFFQGAHHQAVTLEQVIKRPCCMDMRFISKSSLMVVESALWAATTSNKQKAPAGHAPSRQEEADQFKCASRPEQSSWRNGRSSHHCRLDFSTWKPRFGK